VSLIQRCRAADTGPRRSGFSREGPGQSRIFVASEVLFAAKAAPTGQYISLDLTPGQIHRLLRKEGVEGFQQADVIDGFAEQIQHLQAQQIGDVIHVGMS